MTRSHKANDRDHKGLAEGTALPVEHLPRYFAKSGYADVDPKKIKKDGGGKGNWYATRYFLPTLYIDVITRPLHELFFFLHSQSISAS